MAVTREREKTEKKMESDTSGRLRRERRTAGGSTFFSAKQIRTRFLFFALLIPVLHWLVFWLYINIDTFVLAFKAGAEQKWTLLNFRLLWDSLVNPVGDNSIGIALKNTLLYFGATLLLILPFSLVIGYFFYKKILGYKVFRVIFYLPAIISGVALVSVYRGVVTDPWGLVAKLTEILFGKGHFPSGGLLSQNSTATWMILLYSIWTGPCTNILLIGGAMTRIPTEVIESAKIEGCGPFRELIQIILPMIWPTVSTIVVFMFTNIFNTSGPILLFTGGSAGTTTLAFWIFKQIYGDGQIGGAGEYNLVSCTGLVFTLIGVPIILGIRKLIDKVDSGEY